MKIKKGDKVNILAGKDKGKSGKLLKIFKVENKAIVEGLNLVIKHVRPRKEGEKGQRIEVPSKINISKLMLVCSKCGKATRIGYRKSGENKSRVCKKCQSEI